MTHNVTSNSPKFFMSDDGETKFVEGINASVTLTDALGVEILKKTFNHHEEFQTFVDTYLTSFPGYSFAIATFIPPRTNSWHAFSKDVFFPTLVNHSLKEKRVARKIFGSLAGLSLDLLTLLPRLATSPFRLLYMNSIHQTCHPLIQMDGPQEIAKHDYLVAHIFFQTVEIDESLNNNNGLISFKASIKTSTISLPIITNYFASCPIMEEIEHIAKIALYEGVKEQDNSISYISNFSQNQIIVNLTKYHLFSDFDRSAIIAKTFVSKLKT